MILKYACCVFLICTTAFGASVWYASPTGRADAACTVDDPGTVQAAVNKAANGSASASDTVILKSGVYDYSDVIWSNKNCITVESNKNYLTIRSETGNPEDVVIRGRGAETYISDDLLTTNKPFYSRALYTSSRLYLSGLTFTNFYFNSTASVVASSGKRQVYYSNCIVAGNNGEGCPAIYCPAVISDCAFIGNVNTEDGGVMNCDSQTIYATNTIFAANHARSASIAAKVKGDFVNCIISNNTSTASYGCFTGIDSLLSFIGCHIYGNSAPSASLAYFRRGTFRNCLVVSNSATGGQYGVFEVYAGYVDHYDSIFEGNSATGNYGVGGGRVHTINAYNSEFAGNFAGGDGGVFSLDKASLVRGCFFTNNYVNGAGGAITTKNDCSPVITNCTFVKNYAKSKGGVISGHPHKVYCSEFIENSASVSGGAINYGGQYYKCRFVKNQAPDYGVSNCGIQNLGYYDCEFFENVATGNGGALNRGTFIRCLFYRNKANNNGAFGGVYSTTVKYCTFIENEAQSFGVGGGSVDGMYNCLFLGNKTKGTSAELFSLGSFYNCTFISNNVANKPIFTGTGSVNNCLFYDNKPYDIGATKSRDFYNSLYKTKGASYTLTDCILTGNPRFNMGRNPKLADYAPGVSSPARDSGKWFSWATNSVDISSKGRIHKIIDIGCYEYWPHGLQTILSAQ